MRAVDFAFGAEWLVPNIHRLARNGVRVEKDVALGGHGNIADPRAAGSDQDLSGTAVSRGSEIEILGVAETVRSQQHPAPMNDRPHAASGRTGSPLDHHTHGGGREPRNIDAGQRSRCCTLVTTFSNRAIGTAEPEPEPDQHRTRQPSSANRADRPMPASRSTILP